MSANMKHQCGAITNIYMLIGSTKKDYRLTPADYESWKFNHTECEAVPWPIYRWLDDRDSRLLESGMHRKIRHAIPGWRSVMHENRKVADIGIAILNESNYNYQMWCGRIWKLLERYERTQSYQGVLILRNERYDDEYSFE